MKQALYILVTLTLVACGRPKATNPTTQNIDTGPTNCTMVAASGISVQATLPAGARAQDLQIVASDAGYSETIEVYNNSGSTFYAAGAYERAGSYTVRFYLQNVLKATRQVTVTQGQCHVDTQTITIDLSH